MNRHLINAALALGLLVAAATASAQDSAAQWAGKQQAALDAVNDAALAGLLKQGAPALDALLAEVKTGYASDPVALTRIAALTQYVMRPDGASGRTAYAGALLAAAQRAGDADIICFFLDQLRWCGRKEDVPCVRAIGEKASDPAVRDFAFLVARELDR